jgi:FemAB-related protein (PEP-CTERM system-associated)
LNIIGCDNTHAAEWNAYVHASPRASFYHRWEWRDIVTENFGHQTAYLAALESGRIVGVFPLVRLKSFVFGNIACSLPFLNYGGPCGDSDAIEQQLLEEAEKVANAWGVEYLEIRSQRHLGDRYPVADHKVSMTLALDPDPDVFLARLKREQRHQIRRAERSGFVTRFGPELLDDFYQVLSESWRDLGTPIYRLHYLRSIVAAFPDTTQVCVVYGDDGRPAAGAFNGVHNGTLEGMWLGMRSEARKKSVGYVLYWEMIKRACELGHHSFHLGRSSKDSGGEQFKKKWNAEPLQLYWHYFLRSRTAVPTLNPTNPKYQLAIQAWRTLPLTVTQLVGPLVARSIP